MDLQNFKIKRITSLSFEDGDGSVVLDLGRGDTEGIVDAIANVPLINQVSPKEIEAAIRGLSEDNGENVKVHIERQ